VEYPTLHDGTSIRFTKSNTAGDDWKHYVMYPDVKIISKVEVNLRPSTAAESSLSANAPTHRLQMASSTSLKALCHIMTKAQEPGPSLFFAFCISICSSYDMKLVYSQHHSTLLYSIHIIFIVIPLISSCPLSGSCGCRRSI
jgi:hypothetical protein